MSLRTAVGFFTTEIRLIGSRAAEVWRMVPRQHKAAFMAAGGIMSLGCLATVGIPLMLGWLIDNVQTGSTQGLGKPDLFRTAAIFLCGIAGLVFMREGLNVLRR